MSSSGYEVVCELTGKFQAGTVACGHENARVSGITVYLISSECIGESSTCDSKLSVIVDAHGSLRRHQVGGRKRCATYCD